MTIRSLNLSAKTAATLFLIFVIAATASSVILLGLGLSGEKKGLVVPTVSQIKNKYTTSALVGSMRGSMYEFVTADEDIELVEEWVKNGHKKEDPLYEDVSEIIKLDCTNCHSRTSTMTRAIPSMPFESYEDIVVHVDAGYSWKQMSKQAHIHMYGIAMFLIIVALLFAYSTYAQWVRMGLIVSAFGAGFLDIFSWWFSKYITELVYLIFIMGSIMVGSILLMSVLVLVDMWRKEA